MSAAYIRHSTACMPDLYKQAMDSAYSEGWDAWYNGHDENANPYQPFTPECRAWTEGHNDACGADEVSLHISRSVPKALRGIAALK